LGRPDVAFDGVVGHIDGAEEDAGTFGGGIVGELDESSVTSSCRTSNLVLQLIHSMGTLPGADLLKIQAQCGAGRCGRGPSGDAADGRLERPAWAGRRRRRKTSR
jgi:hypothetical protein